MELLIPDDENPTHTKHLFSHDSIIENGSNHDMQKKISYKQKF